MNGISMIAPQQHRPDAAPDAAAAARDLIYPQAFGAGRISAGADRYLSEPAIRRLAEFFEAKGLGAIKEEDRNEQWYEDWIAYQAGHRLYAMVLSPKQYSNLGSQFDLLRLARFLEVFAYFSPAHGYSFQVSFLGLFSILMGSNPALKQEAVAALESGGLLAFGISEKAHGSDLFGNEFTIKEAGAGRFVADGTKYYIGNSSCAAIISILAKKDEGAGAGTKRAPFVLLALRPKESKGFRNIRKIRTLGVRAGYVGEFEVHDHELTAGDIIAEGRRAWDSVLGTVTLGKFFLGFGSVGICERALEEATGHLSKRILYGKPVIEMPHIRLTAAQAYARLTAMKLYAYRALDYVHASSEADRRYLLFCAVQKAKVSNEAVKVMALLCECMGAKAFESDTYFEMALRDVQLIPNLEGSTHINLGLAAQFIGSYFVRPVADLADPKSLIARGTPAGENPYLMEATTGALNRVAFAHFLRAYRPLRSVRNVRIFCGQAKALRLFLGACAKRATADDAQAALALGECLAVVAYAQLIAENAVLLRVPSRMVSAVFHTLVSDLTISALKIASLPGTGAIGRMLVRRAAASPVTGKADWDFVSEQLSGEPG
jgi:acyl-CoA dehydrogenase